MGKLITTIIAPTGIRQANPFGINEVAITEVLDDTKTIFYTKSTIEGTLKFIGDDFHLLYDWETSDKRCRKFTLLIQEQCTDGLKDLFRQSISADEISWNPDRCQCEIKLTAKQSDYDPYEEFKGIKYNIFSLVSNRIVWDKNPNGSITQNIANGVLLYEALSAMLNKAYGGIQLRSSFFGWGEPQGTIIGNSDKLQRLILAQNSDVYTADATENATIMETTLEKLLTALVFMFNMKCDIEDNIFRVEHISYFDEITAVVEDATQGESLKFNSGKLSNFTYSDKERYSVETFDSKRLTNWIDSRGLPIEYNNCYSSTVNTNKMEVDFTLDITGETIYAEDFYSDDLLSGITIVALNGTNSVIQLPHLLIDSEAPDGFYYATDPAYSDYPNNVLGWAYLAKDYHKSNKSYSRAKINGEWVDVSARRYRVQEGVKIATCCSDYSIINGTVITGLGEGRVMKTKKALGKPYIEADVFFYDVATEELAAPSATDDQYYTTTDTVIDTDADSLPKLIDNDTGAGLTVYAEIKETESSGTVEILEDGNFIYTPKAGFDGFDSFDYYVINSDGLVDTGKVNIAVRIPIVYVKKTFRGIIDNTIGATTPVVDYSLIEYYRDVYGSILYDTTGMGLKMYYKGQYYDGTPYVYSTNPHIAHGSSQQIPRDDYEYNLPELGSTLYFKLIIFDSSYGYDLV